MNTILQELTDGLGKCEPASPCQYHLSKRDSASLQFSPVITETGFQAGILASTPTTRFGITAIESQKQPAGSWNLVSEESTWARKRFRAFFDKRAQNCVITILGIAGLQHFIDSLDLLLASLPRDYDGGLHVYVIDRCSTPIKDIEQFCASRPIIHGRIINSVRDQSLKATSEGGGQVKVEAIQGDISQQCPTEADLALSHYLFRFMDKTQAAACMAAITAMLQRRKGKLLAAQDQVSYMPDGVVGFFEKFGFGVIDQTVSWAPYKLSQTARSTLKDGTDIEVELECTLLELQAP